MQKGTARGPGSARDLAPRLIDAEIPLMPLTFQVGSLRQAIYYPARH